LDQIQFVFVKKLEEMNTSSQGCDNSSKEAILNCFGRLSSKTSEEDGFISNNKSNSNQDGFISNNKSNSNQDGFISNNKSNSNQDGFISNNKSNSNQFSSNTELSPKTTVKSRKNLQYSFNLKRRKNVENNPGKEINGSKSITNVEEESFKDKEQIDLIKKPNNLNFVESHKEVIVPKNNNSLNETKITNVEDSSFNDKVNLIKNKNSLLEDSLVNNLSCKISNVEPDGHSDHEDSDKSIHSNHEYSDKPIHSDYEDSDKSIHSHHEDSDKSIHSDNEESEKSIHSDDENKESNNESEESSDSESDRDESEKENLNCSHNKKISRKTKYKKKNTDLNESIILNLKQSYDHEKNNYNNKDDYVFINIPILAINFFDTIILHPFIQSKFINNGLKYNKKLKAIIHLNLKDKSFIENKDEYLDCLTKLYKEDLIFKNILDSSTETTIFTQYYSKCQHNSCVNNNCSAQYKYTLIYNKSTNTYQIKLYFKGKHSLEFYPNHLLMTKHKGIKSYIKNHCLLMNNENIINELDRKYNIKSVNNYSFLIDNSYINQIRDRVKKKLYGKNKNSFNQALLLLSDLIQSDKSISIVEEVNGKKIHEMTQDDYCFIFYKNDTIKKQDIKENFYKHILMDSNFKVGKLKNKKITFFLLMVEDNKLYSNIFAAILVGNKRCHIKLNDAFNALKVHLKNNFNYDFSNFNPSFSTDCDSAQIKFFRLNKFIFFFCKFHFFEDFYLMFKKKKEFNLSKELKQTVINYLYKLWTEKNESNTKKLYNDLLNDVPKKDYKDFYKYFNFWWKLKNHWLGCKRPSNYGSFNVTNVLENEFKQSNKSFLDSRKNFCFLVSNLITYIKTRSYLVDYKNKTTDINHNKIREIKNRITNGYEYFKNDQVKKLENEDLYLINSTEDYTVDLFNFNCTCTDYIINGRLCKHIFSCIFYYFKTKKIQIIIPENPFDFIKLFRIHYFENNIELKNEFLNNYNHNYPINTEHIVESIKKKKNPNKLFYSASNEDENITNEDEFIVEEVVNIYLDDFENNEYTLKADCLLKNYNEVFPMIFDPVNDIMGKFIDSIKKNININGKISPNIIKIELENNEYSILDKNNKKYKIKLINPKSINMFIDKFLKIN
jgi:hypothetical protein